jgi:hypothetical protein
MSDFEKTRYEAQLDDNPHSHCTDGSIDEDAYRRGFQQGSVIALKAIKDGIHPKRLERWRMAVYRWRFMRSHKKRTPAPLPHAITRRERIAYDRAMISARNAAQKLVQTMRL